MLEFAGRAYEEAAHSDDLRFFYGFLHGALGMFATGVRPPAEAADLHRTLLQWLDSGAQVLRVNDDESTQTVEQYARATRDLTAGMEKFFSVPAPKVPDAESTDRPKESENID
ncbi:hypothetical protein BBK14_30695 [Parafrankia soli]|uniref:Uncharacterized protein n=1 Tax=Parafrankia soli TaxID=2599596 RepID=A0A1S1RHM8_9ACTN|nr:hypothetical protein BBK14_30695 [Parafrankia soli]